MNCKNLLKGAFGVLAGSFIAGGIHTIVKSRRETKEICKQTEASIAESEELIAKAKEQLKETDKLIEETDNAIAEAHRTQMAIDATWKQLEEIYGEEQVKRFREIQHISYEKEEPSD